MTIFSTIKVDDSSSMAKRFARNALRYLKDPTSIDMDVLDVSVENLYRLSEMFRLGTYADEPRMGVMAAGGAQPLPVEFLQSEVGWEGPIVRALEQAFQKAYGARTDQEINTFQGALREIAPAKEIAPQSKDSLRTFLEAFGSNLA
jgi:hypothetical protein